MDEKQPIKIICEDCITGMKQLPANSVDLVVTDPPFNFDTGGRGFFGDRPVFSNIKESFGSDFKPEPFLRELPRIMKKFNAFIFCNKTLIKNYIDFAIKHNYNYDVLIWAKPNPIPTKNNHFLPDIEYIIYIKEPGAFFNNDLPFSHYRKVQVFDSPRKDFHPTVKPLELIRRLVRVGSKPGELVLDCYTGSGTTAAACKQLGRDFTGFEINPDYVETANKRLRQENLTDFV